MSVVSKFNYLGVLLDENLSFAPHSEKVQNSGDVKLKHLRRLKKYMDESLALLMYKQMIMPALEYCDFLVESGPVGLAEGLQTIQNHCLRCCLGIIDPRLITREALHIRCKCNWLWSRRQRNLLSLMYKHTRNPDNLIVPARTLCSNVMMKIKLQRPKGQLYRDSPLYRGSFLWDKVPPNKQEIVTYDLFMNTVKNLVL